MLARIVMFAAFSSLLGSAPAIFAGHESYARAAASVIQVAAAVPGQGSAVGSGVVLPDGRVVTNCHVTRGAKSLAVIDAVNYLTAAPNESDFAADLCILTTGKLSTPPAQLGSSHTVKLGDEVVAVGFGGGVNKTLSVGYITALYPYRGGYVMRTSAVFSPGASGGGLFDRNGQLVGIITFFRYGEIENSFFAIPAEWVETLPYSVESANTAALPFWMRNHADQPRFLQVATFEADGNWHGVARAAHAWVNDEPGTPQAWETLIQALRKTGQPMDITVSLEEAKIDTGKFAPSEMTRKRPVVESTTR